MPGRPMTEEQNERREKENENDKTVHHRQPKLASLQTAVENLKAL